MKFVKKLTALFLAIVMTMAMGITAFADEATTYTITGPKDGHTYKIYQIFTGDLSEGTLSNIVAGSNYKSSKGDAATAAEAIAAFTETDQALADKIADYVDFESNAVGTLTDDNNTWTGAAGYYLLKDTGATTGDTDAYSTYVVKVVGNVTVTTKKDTPEFEKKVKDINDSTDTNYSGWQDSADHDIHDQVPFQLKGTVADNYANYTTYYFAFHDVEEQGLTFNSSSVKVYIDETEVTTGYDLVTSPTDGCTFEVVFKDLKKTAAHAGSVITVEYTSELNDKAVLGSTGNVNKAKLEYSNNPNNSQGGKDDDHGNTPWDNVIVFTYKVVVNKVDSESNALKGAAFELQKKGTNGNYTTVSSFTAGEATSFEFKGLDDGDYKLVETTTPAGYNTIADITFTVDANHDITWTSQSRDAVLKSLTGTKATGEITFTPNTSEGSLTTNVVNKKGSELPSTGGMGTTVIYIAGIAMIVAAGVVVIARKRMA